MRGINVSSQHLKLQFNVGMTVQRCFDGEEFTLEEKV